MSVERLRQLLKEHAKDDVITLEEVKALIAAAKDQGEITIGERMTLEAAVEAHAARLTPEARSALLAFLAR